jgi:hypothetical protein
MANAKSGANSVFAHMGNVERGRNAFIPPSSLRPVPQAVTYDFIPVARFDIKPVGIDQATPEPMVLEAVGMGQLELQFTSGVLSSL